MDADSVLATLLAEVTGHDVGDPSPCVEPQSFGAPFSKWPGRTQFSPDDWRAIESGSHAELPATLRVEINDAANAMRQQNKRSAPSVTIPPDAVRSPWRVWQRGKKCDYALEVSSPVQSRNWAFVETASGCGELCGSGELYALRREGAAWRAVAWTDLWTA